jgi:hypothetical protein
VHAVEVSDVVCSDDFRVPQVIGHDPSIPLTHTLGLADHLAGDLDRGGDVDGLDVGPVRLDPLRDRGLAPGLAESEVHEAAAR